MENYKPKKYFFLILANLLFVFIFQCILLFVEYWPTLLHKYVIIIQPSSVLVCIQWSYNRDSVYLFAEQSNCLALKTFTWNVFFFSWNNSSAIWWEPVHGRIIFCHHLEGPMTIKNVWILQAPTSKDFLPRLCCFLLTKRKKCIYKNDQMQSILEEGWRIYWF